MSDTAKVERFLHAGSNALFDGHGRLVGVYNATTGRGMFADCFFEREGGAARANDGAERSNDGVERSAGGRGAMKRRVLDPCCGSRMFYFNKAAPDVLYCDCRRVSERLCDGRALRVEPDVLADVRDLPFADGAFALVVFDPPHLTRGRGWQAAKYGTLPADWRDFMGRAFSECWRVLAPDGTLVFKWSEHGVKLAEVLECAPARPLLGNRKPGQSKTHWLVFFKGAGEVEA